MSSLGTIKIKGKSGKAYKFKSYPLDTVFDEGLGGVYILTKRRFREATRTQRHKPLMLGHNANLRESNIDTSDPFYADANCICVLVEKDEIARQGIHQDLTLSGSRENT
ncbi:MAG: hypothetical protein JXA11_04340 [Phycisphaerae bacterium]|nr:hypothetical protein [Phycisphaerae bacterium]